MEDLLVRAINSFFELLNLMILVRIILTLLRFNPYNKYYTLLVQLTEPILEPFRKLIYKLGIDTGMIDFSPLAAFFFITWVVKPLLLMLIDMIF